MKLYPDVARKQGLSDRDILDNGTWALYADVRCQDCGKEYSLASVGGIGGPCKKCGGICL